MTDPDKDDLLADQQTTPAKALILIAAGLIAIGGIAAGIWALWRATEWVMG